MPCLEELYRAYRQDVYSYLLHFTRDAHVAEDLLSETFLRALVALPSFRGQAAPKTWLLGIARNVWLQWLRARRPAASFDDLLEVYVADGPEQQALGRAAVQRAAQLLAQKDQRTRAVLVLRVQGYPFGHIAGQLGISEASARVLAHRARTWLKECLQKEGLL